MRVGRTTEALPAPVSAASNEPSTESAARSSAVETGATPSNEAGASARGSGAQFAQVLRHLGRELDRGEHLAESAIRGGHSDMSPSRLIALQAGIYRYSEAVDLVTKLVDRGTQAVRTTLQNQ